MRLIPTSLRVLFATLTIGLFPLSALSSETVNLLVNETELAVQYGVYSEATLSLPDAGNRTVEWTILGSNIPPGLSIYDTQSSNLILYGTPTFTGTWCTVYVARVGALNGATELFGQGEVCFNSKENDALQYPRFTRTTRYLEVVNPQASFIEFLGVTDSSRSGLTGELYENSFPAQTTTVGFSGNQFNVRGTIQTPGSYSFGLKVTNQQGVESYHQYVLLLENKQENPTCPAGYYYDTNLGYCVIASQEVNCPAGTYYESTTRACVQYPVPPPTIRCSVGYYFDPFLSSCVPAYAERCPLNYSYDVYEGRCVREPYTCGYGERYDYFVKDCVRVYRQTCSYNEHFDYYRNQCVRNYDSCYPGFYYSYSYNRCVAVADRCGYDEVFDPRYGGCRRIISQTSCPYGTRYDWSLNRCISVYASYPQHCSPGYRYDPIRRACVGYNPYPIPHPRPAPIPRPAYCPPGSGYDPRVGRCTVLSTPRPRPPMPRPVPGGPSCPPGTVYNGGRCSPPNRPDQPRPAPRPMPRQEQPRPMPRPDQPRPAPQPRHEQPRPMPRQEQPRPAPQPRPEQPRPMPRPDQPRPAPQPRHEQPRPMPRQEQPRHEQPRPMPRQEQPRHEQPRPMPRQEQPRQEQPRHERQEQPGPSRSERPNPGGRRG